MSSLTTTTVTSANGATDLTIRTGNTSGPSLVVKSQTDVVIKANTSADVFIANSSAIRANTNFTAANNLTVVGQATLNTVANGVSFAGNTTFVNVVATSIRTTNAVVTSNSLALGSPSIATSGHSRLPNGILLQWGTVTSVTTSGKATTFPVAFAAAPYSINITPRSDQRGWVTTTSSTSFTIDSTGTSDYFYMAIGI